MRFLAGVVFFVPTILALAFDAPEATLVINNLNLDLQSWSPQPTEAPEFKELVRRQASGTSTLVEAPDSLCGYKFGISSSGFGLCGTTARCGFATTPLGYGSVYCFSSTVTEARTWTSCNGGNAASSCLLDSLCKSNPLVVICIGTQSLCNVGTFVGQGVTAVWCDISAYPGTITVSTTYAGQVGRSLSTVGFLTPSKPTVTSSSISSSKSSSPSTSTSSSTSSSSSSLSRPASSSTSTQSSTSSVSRSTTTSPTVSPTVSPVPPAPQSKTPIGAIVGGVIGGLALIAAIAVGIFFFLRQRKRSDKQTTPEISGPPPSQTINPGNNPQPHYPSEKYATTAQATYIAPGPTSGKPGEQFQYQQQPPQPQYQQIAPVAQPYNGYQAVPQQQLSSSQAQQYYPQGVQAQPQHLPVHPQPSSHELSDGNRGSVVSAVSAPGSPAPPYTGTIPTVPEVPGQSSHHARPIPDRYEMPGAH